MIDILDQDELLALSDAARRLPKIQGRKLHSSTVWRWVRVGVKSRSGQRVKLEAVRIGARVFTSAAALNRFVAQVAAADTAAFETRATEAPPKGPTSTQGQQSVKAAECTLARAGIL